MKVANAFVLNTRLALQDQIRELELQINKLFFAMQGRVSFGTGTDGNNGENISGQFQQFTTSGTPDAENTITHTIGSIPLGYIVLWQDKAGSLYQSPTSGTDWTASAVYLKCDVATTTFLIFLVKQGNTT